MGINALWGGMHANFSNTHSAFTATYWDMGASPSAGTDPGDNPDARQSQISSGTK